MGRHRPLAKGCDPKQPFADDRYWPVGKLSTPALSRAVVFWGTKPRHQGTDLRHIRYILQSKRTDTFVVADFWAGSEGRKLGACLGYPIISG